jgi:hypothetical protein
MLPNLYISCWGKIIFAIGDLIGAWLVYRILKDYTKNPEI